jgi:dTDP-L-rhamnose 4-epimerase
MVGNGQSMHEIVRYTQVNVVGTAVLLESVARRRDRVRRLIVASSMVVYGDGAYACAEHGILSVPPARPLERLRARLWEPVCPRCDAEVTPVPITEDRALAPTSTYGITKRDQEELCLVLGRAYGIETIALRYLNTYGSRQALSNPYTGVCAIMAMRLRLGKAPTVFEDGRQLRDPTHVSDVVRATILASEAGDAALYQAFNVGAGEPVSVAEMASALARALGEDIAPHVTAEFRQGDIRHCFADISRAARLLSFQPRVRFEDGARELAEWVSRETPVDHTERANDELRARGLLG